MSVIISVIIPTNNPDKYLYECLNALAKQTIGSDLIEVLIIINGCTKNRYKKTCNQLTESHKNINLQVLYEEAAGVSRARNIGLNHALGDYIAFVDDDDLVSNSYLEKLYAEAALDSIVVSNLYCFTENIKNYYGDYLNQAFKHLQGKKYSIISYRKFFSVCHAKLIPRQMIGNYRFNEFIHLGEDGLFMATISHNIKNISLANEDCIYYRRVTTDSLSRSRKNTYYLYKQRLKLIMNYLVLWLKEPMDRSFLFVCSRILAISIHLVKRT